MKIADLKGKIDFHPKLFSCLREYNKQKFAADLTAGIVVGIVALPLAIAFGIASGVSPEKGLITAIIGGFIVSFLGGSNVQIGGPTGAFIVIVAGVIAKYGIEGLAIATVMAGVMLILMGLFKLGALIKFIPYPVIVGFTGGIALTIFATQIKDFFGLQMDSVPSEFIPKWIAYFQHIGTVNWWSLGIGALSLIIIVMAPKISKKIPGSLLAILIVTVIAWALQRFCGVSQIETIGDRFTINASLPSPQGFSFSMETLNSLLPVAFTIAILSAIESLLSATVADGVTGDKHNSNTELIAQGAANIVVPMFGGIPVTGAIARTMTNINNGGRTPVAGIIHAVVLLLILLFLSPLTRYIPMACLAAVLIIVSYNMSDWRTIKSMMKNPKSDVAVLITTLVLTVVFDLTIAISAGLFMAIFLFLRRIMETTNVSVIKDRINTNAEHTDSIHQYSVIDIPDGVEVYEIDGPYFFGMANKFDEVMRRIKEKPKIRIIRLYKVPFIDSTGLHNLSILINASHKEGITIILSGVNANVRRILVHNDIDELVGENNICDNIHLAIARAQEILDEQGGES